MTWFYCDDSAFSMTDVVPTVRIGDVLVSHDGQRLPVEGVADSGRVEAVYNLAVEDDHTYFVGGGEWDGAYGRITIAITLFQGI